MDRIALFYSCELQRIDGEHRTGAGTRTGTRARQSDRGWPVCCQRCPCGNWGQHSWWWRCFSSSETHTRQV